MNLTSFYIENGRLKKARSVNEDMKRSLAHKERSTVIYETLMADYYRKIDFCCFRGRRDERLPRILHSARINVRKESTEVLREKTAGHC